MRSGANVQRPGVGVAPVGDEAPHPAFGHLLPARGAKALAMRGGANVQRPGVGVAPVGDEAPHPAVGHLLPARGAKALAMRGGANVEEEPRESSERAIGGAPGGLAGGCSMLLWRRLTALLIRCRRSSERPTSRADPGHQSPEMMFPSTSPAMPPRPFDSSRWPPDAAISRLARRLKGSVCSTT